MTHNMQSELSDKKKQLFALSKNNMRSNRDNWNCFQFAFIWRFGLWFRTKLNRVGRKFENVFFRNTTVWVDRSCIFSVELQRGRTTTNMRTEPKIFQFLEFEFSCLWLKVVDSVLVLLVVGLRIQNNFAHKTRLWVRFKFKLFSPSLLDFFNSEKCMQCAHVWRTCFSFSWFLLFPLSTRWCLFCVSWTASEERARERLKKSKIMECDVLSMSYGRWWGLQADHENELSSWLWRR